MKAREMPDFNKIHPVYDKYKENGKEAVFVTGDYV
jgi:hypothetical protein